MSRLLVLALHGSPGDPERAREDFGFLHTGRRPLELLLLSDRRVTASQQLAELIERYPHSEITLAPLLLGAGYHYRHDLLPAMKGRRGLRLLPVFGRSDAFLEALAKRIRTLSDEPVHWLVPGGVQVADDLREALKLLGSPIASRSYWYPLTKAELPPDLTHAPQGQPLLAVLRDGRIAEQLRVQWRGSAKLRLLFELDGLQGAVGRWIEDTSQGGLLTVESPAVLTGA